MLSDRVRGRIRRDRRRRRAASSRRSIFVDARRFGLLMYDLRRGVVRLSIRLSVMSCMMVIARVVASAAIVLHGVYDHDCGHFEQPTLEIVAEEYAHAVGYEQEANN